MIQIVINPNNQLDQVQQEQPKFKNDQLNEKQNEFIIIRPKGDSNRSQVFPIEQELQEIDISSGANQNESQKINISFENLEYEFINKKSVNRKILDNISGICKGGEITAIMGSSGAGKTSLLNLLAKRIDPSKQKKIRGYIRANDVEYNYNDFPNFASYVMQDDRLLESMTVSETIEFAIRLRKPHLADVEVEKTVDELIHKLNLDRARHTRIGGHYLKGVSGGERKRVSIAFELANDPQVLLLDEPTSGLDSFTAFQLILVLKQEAKRGKTIIFTIHQPSVDIWNMFDRIILLSKGKLIYQGPGQMSVVKYIQQGGFECPQNSNPADYIMQLMQDDPENQENLKKLFQLYEEEIKLKTEKEVSQACSRQLQYPVIHKSSFMQQMRQIIKRGIIDTKRNPVVSSAWIVLNVFLSFFLAIIYWKMPTDHDNPFDTVTASNRAAFLFMAIFINSTYGTYPLTLTFPMERGVFLKEYGMKLYSLPAYFFGRFIPSIPTSIIHPIIFSVITYWTIGLNDTDESFFFKYLLTNFLILLSGCFIGIIIGAMFKESHTASVMVVFITLPLVLFSGFIGNRENYQSWIGWFEYLSPFKYAFEGHIQSQFQDTLFVPNPIESLNFTISYWDNVIYQILIIIGYAVLAYFNLKYHAQKLQ